MKGIYRILNTVNRKEYIGSSKDTDFRWRTHRAALRRGTHANIILQRSWNKYGEAAFVFEVLEEVADTPDLLVIEQRYLEERKPALNVGKQAKGGDNVSQHPRNAEIRQKHADNCYWKTEAGRAFARNRTGARNSNYGNRWSPAQKEAARKWMLLHYEANPSVRKGKTLKEIFGAEQAAKIRSKISRMASQRTGDKNPFYGKTHSADAKAKISKSNRGRIPTTVTRVSIDGIEYVSLTEASRSLGIPVPTIWHRTRSSNPKFASYFYVK